VSVTEALPSGWIWHSTKSVALSSALAVSGTWQSKVSGGATQWVLYRVLWPLHSAKVVVLPSVLALALAKATLPEFGSLPSGN
jgi:hypothetical protein